MADHVFRGSTNERTTKDLSSLTEPQLTWMVVGFFSVNDKTTTTQPPKNSKTKRMAHYVPAREIGLAILIHHFHHFHHLPCLCYQPSLFISLSVFLSTQRDIKERLSYCCTTPDEYAAALTDKSLKKAKVCKWCESAHLMFLCFVCCRSSSILSLTTIILYSCNCNITTDELPAGRRMPLNRELFQCGELLFQPQAVLGGA
jgi:hypothetical protein